MSRNFKYILFIVLLGILFVFVINPVMGKRLNSNHPELVEEAIILYRESSGYTGNLSGEIKNFGCHLEIWILNDNNEIVSKYSKWGNRLQPIR